jgi:signal transduction histidine kinase
LKKSLRNKIIAWSFVPTAIILVAVTLVSVYTYQRVTENLVIERDRELTRLAAQVLATDLAAYTDPLAEQFLGVFDGMVMFNAKGTILAAEPEGYEQYTPRWFHDISLYQVLNSDAPVYSDVVNDRVQGEKMVVVVIPLSNSAGESMGGIAGLFRLDQTAGSPLFRSIEGLRRGESNCIYLVDSTGNVIYHSNPEYIGEDFSPLLIVDLVLEGWAGAYRTQDFEGEEIVASFAPVPGTTWGLVTEESWDALTATSRRYSSYLLMLLALGVVAPTFIVTVGVRRITRPINELIAAAKEIAGGNFGRRISSGTGDELEQLGDQFNAMAGQLQESYADLERKVEDRTKELATLNAIAAEVSQTLDLQEILDNALDEVLGVMSMDCGQAFRLESSSQVLIRMASRGLSAEFERHTVELPLAHSVAGLAAEQGRPVVMLAPFRTDLNLGQRIQAEGLQSIISVPLIAHRRVVGAINLGARSARRFTREELALLAAIGNQIGVAVENARLYEQAQQLAVIKERNRLSRDLHDSVTQALYGVSLYSEAAARQLLSGDSDRAVQHLREIRATAQESLREMRLLVFELRLPMLKEEGLPAALQARLESVESRVGLQTDFSSDLDKRLPANTEETLYRVAQEALNNALRHARASRVSVVLHQNRETICLEIRDDGIGFDPEKAQEQCGFGLRIMKERVQKLGGTFDLESSPGKGTSITVEVSQA